MIIKSSKHLTLFRIIILSTILSVIFISWYVASSSLLNQQSTRFSDLAEINRKLAITIREARRKRPVYILLPNANPIRAIVEDYSLSGSIWSLVNKTHSIPTDYIPTGLAIPDVATRTDKSNDERSIRSDIATAMKSMFDKAKSEGYSLMIGSGYRSANLQGIYFYSLANSVGENSANQSIARPGQSEHQTGLAADITTISRDCYLSDCFADTADGIWLAKNAHKFGFILRYPLGKESITGYRYEPWHFRYVGVDLATAIYESGLTLDEAWPYLETAQDTLIKNGAILP